MLWCSDVMVVGWVEYFCNLLCDNFILVELKVCLCLFENMFGNEQDILFFGQFGEVLIVVVNLCYECLLLLWVVVVGQVLNLFVVYVVLIYDGILMCVFVVEVLVGGCELLQIIVVYLLLGEMWMFVQYCDWVIVVVLLVFFGIVLFGWLVLCYGLCLLCMLVVKVVEIYLISLDICFDVVVVFVELQQVVQLFNVMFECLDDGYQCLQQFFVDFVYEICMFIGLLMGYGQVVLCQLCSNEEYQVLIVFNQEELECIVWMVESILFFVCVDDVWVVVECSCLDLGEELWCQVEYFEGLVEECGLSFDVQVSGQLCVDL